MTELTILCLPPEVLGNILAHLPIVDLLRAAQTCHVFNAAAHVTYSRNRRHQVEKITSSYIQDPCFLTFHEVFQLLMSHCEHILGTWKIVSTCYGGLVQVEFDGYKIIGKRYGVPPNPHTEMPLTVTKMFAVQVDLCGQVQYVCYRGYNGPHSSTIEQRGVNGFCFNCSNPELHPHKNGTKVEYSIWLCNELGMQKNSSELHVLTPLHEEKFRVLCEENSIECVRLLIPSHKDNAIIQPGLFLGTYGDHGLELVMLSYDDEQRQAVITKITGDPNVPAEKVSAIVDVSCVINSSQNEQCECHDNMQPRFLLPEDYHNRTLHTPKTCLARYKSKGQIAGHGFLHPMFVEGNWVVFDENTFGHVWITLSAFSFYSRVVDKTFT